MVKILSYDATAIAEMVKILSYDAAMLRCSHLRSYICHKGNDYQAGPSNFIYININKLS